MTTTVSACRCMWFCGVCYWKGDYEMIVSLAADRWSYVIVFLCGVWRLGVLALAGVVRCIWYQRVLCWIRC